jgi:hypothetical protein
MINKFEAVEESERGDRITSYESVWYILTYPAAICRILTRRYILSRLALCLSLSSIAAIVVAQDVAPNAVKTTTHSTFGHLKDPDRNWLHIW